MDNVVIPDAPTTAPITESIPYSAPYTPVYGEYTRVSFDPKTGDMIKDKYIKSKNTALILHLLGFISIFGLGDFYCNQIAKGLLKTFTGGGLFIWAIIDIIKTLKGKYATNGKCILL